MTKQPYRKSRREVEKLFESAFEGVRQWIQDRGGWGIVYGFLAGIFFVLAFRILFALCVIAGIGAFLFWWTSPFDNSSH